MPTTRKMKRKDHNSIEVPHAALQNKRGEPLSVDSLVRAHDSNSKPPAEEALTCKAEIETTRTLVKLDAHLTPLPSKDPQTITHEETDRYFAQRRKEFRALLDKLNKD